MCSHRKTCVFRSLGAEPGVRDRSRRLVQSQGQE